MEIKITKKDVIWGYAAQFFNIGAGVLLLPIILKLLSTELLGVWYIFLTIAGFVQMLDFGFQSTFTRNVAYIFSGAIKLQAKGINNEEQCLDAPNYPLLKDMIRTMKQFYGLISLAIIILLYTAGSWYIQYKTNSLTEHNEIMIAWYIYTFSIVMNFFYSYYNSLLTGRGFIKENNQLIIITRSVYIVLATIGLICGYGIVAVAFANLFSIFINRILAVHFFNKHGLKDILRSTIKSNEKLLSTIWFNARKVGLVNVGGFFVQKGNLLFVSIFLPLETVASYGLTINLVAILSGISPLYLSAHLPELYKDRMNHNLKEIKRIFGESILIYVVLYTIGAIVILGFGNYFLELFNSKTLLIPTIPLLLLLIVQFLESNHAMSSTLITTRNEIPFLRAALISGGCIAILSPSSLAFTSWGITGVIAVTGIVQLCYNNWKWPLIVCQELEKNYPQLMLIGFISLKGWFFRHFNASFLSK